MRSILVCATIAAVSCCGEATAASKTRIALDLGTVIGSEEGCGFRYSQPAIEAFIERNVPASDMEFMTTMNNAAAVAGSDLKSFSSSQRTAHCAQVRRVAKANGFID